ncbi:unnamed protein product [Rhizophagus irregularis]|nr:unnamed protein product [Rhizophagus irregularis]
MNKILKKILKRVLGKKVDLKQVGFDPFNPLQKSKIFFFRCLFSCNAKFLDLNVYLLLRRFIFYFNIGL